MVALVMLENDFVDSMLECYRCFYLPDIILPLAETEEKFIKKLNYAYMWRSFSHVVGEGPEVID